MKYKYLILHCTIFFVMMQCAIVQADIGIGISGNNQALVIGSFPFAYSNSISIHNAGDEESIYCVRVVGEYTDIVEWIDVNPKIMTIEPRGYANVQYTVHAEEGYTGTYITYLEITAYKEGVKSATLQETPMSYVQSSGIIRISIEVSEEAGLNSMGIQHPSLNYEGIPSGPFKLVVEDIESCSSGVSIETFDRPLYIDIPHQVQKNKLIPLSGGYIGEGEPESMTIILNAPSGETYTLAPSATFIFNEEGTWHAILALGNQPIIGKTIEVLPETRRIWPYIGKSSLIAISFFVAIVYIKKYHLPH
ncbi:MAG: hypothetical protein ACXQS3_01510 [Candidatus Methanofastidiosia archaeon]